MKPILNYVGVYYQYGHRSDTVGFRYKWQALLFHILLNLSKTHAGTKEY